MYILYIIVPFVPYIYKPNKINTKWGTFDGTEVVQVVQMRAMHNKIALRLLRYSFKLVFVLSSYLL